MRKFCKGPPIDASCKVFVPFGQVISEEKIFEISANQKQELPMVAIFVV